MQPIISTWFVADQLDNETSFPQVGARSSTTIFQNVYWRCIAVFFATSYRQNPHARHVLFTNTEPPVVDGHSIKEFLDRLGVETVFLEISYRLPKEAVGSWGNQFYILDILKFVAGQTWEAPLVILDSDCLWVRPVSEIELAIERRGVITYQMWYGEDEKINGLTRLELKEIFEDFTNLSIDDTIRYCGGEFFSVKASLCNKLAEEAENFWMKNLESLGSGKLWFREEGHLLSLVYRKLNYTNDIGNRFIKRMWTTFRVNNVAAEDLELTIWHLPAEKKTGFRGLFKRVMETKSQFWHTPLGAPFISYVGKKVGVPRRPPLKFATDLARKCAEKVLS